MKKELIFLYIFVYECCKMQLLKVQHCSLDIYHQRNLIRKNTVMTDFNAASYHRILSEFSDWLQNILINNFMMSFWKLQFQKSNLFVCRAFERIIDLLVIFNIFRDYFLAGEIFCVEILLSNYSLSLNLNVIQKQPRGTNFSIILVYDAPKNNFGKEFLLYQFGLTLWWK